MAPRKAKHLHDSGHHAPPSNHQTETNPGPTGTDAPIEGSPGVTLEIIVEGPIDEVLGAVLDIGLGDWSGIAIGEFIDATVEHEFWRKSHVSQPHARDGGEYAAFEPAYRVGYTHYIPQKGHERSFADVEHHLRQEYELTDATLPWDQAREAAHAAWTRVHAAQKAMREFLERRKRFSLEHPPISHKAIEERAWFIYENAGYPQGHALDHWLQAEHEQQVHEAIALRAWFIYQNAGYPQGHALDHWLQSEHEHKAFRNAA